MRNTWNIASRELKSYFQSPLGYIVLAMFAFIFGFMFFSAVATFEDYSTSQRFAGGYGPMNINEFVVQHTLSNFHVILLFLFPLISMRLFAEEKRSGTIELLLTSPVKDFEIILGKWLAGMLLYISMLVVVVVNLLILSIYGDPDWKALLAACLGLVLIGGAYLAIGGFISTLTSNQMVAGAVTFAVFLLLFLLSWVNLYFPSTVGRLCSYLSTTTHIDQFSKGLIELKDTVYYLSAIGFGLFLTKRSFESLRWRA